MFTLSTLFSLLLFYFIEPIYIQLYILSLFFGDYSLVSLKTFLSPKKYSLPNIELVFKFNLTLLSKTDFGLVSIPCVKASYFL